MHKIFLFFLFLFIISGCSSHTYVAPKPKKLPVWYLNPPKNSENIVYVTGSGINKKEAILNALSNFIAGYSIKISSVLNINKKSFGGGLYNKNVNYDVKAVISGFEVSDYEVVKVYQYKFDNVLVLVKVDTSKLFDIQKAKLDDRFNRYRLEFRTLLKENKIKRLIGLENLLRKLDKEKNYLYVLKGMNPKFDIKKYLTFIDTVYNTYLRTKTSLKICVKCNVLPIKRDIEKYLIKHNVKIGNSDTVLDVKINKKSSDSIMSLEVYNIYLILKKEDTVIGSNGFKIVVPKNANLNNQLYDEIKNLNIKEFFNIK